MLAILWLIVVAIGAVIDVGVAAYVIVSALLGSLRATRSK